MGIGGTPNANAILDVQSTTKAFMPPRMTTTQMNAVSSPTAGMVIYNSTVGTLYQYVTSWLSLANMQKAYLTADFPKTNNTLANVTDLTIDLVAGHVYDIQFLGYVDNSAGLSRMDFNGGSATITAGNMKGLWQLNDLDTQTITPSSITALNSAAAGGPSGASCVYTARFTIQCLASGTLIPRFAQDSTDASASTLDKYATITRVDIT